jgi:hypothetical protein
MSEKQGPGQPTAYDPKFCVELIEYFSVEPYEETEKEIATKSGDVVTIHVNEANDTPTLAGFACKIGVHRETLLNWTKAHPEFFDAYKRAKELQENFLVVNGNKSLINTAFGIFVMKNLCDYRDRKPDEHDTVINNTNNVVNKLDLEERVKQIKGDE